MIRLSSIVCFLLFGLCSKGQNYMDEMVNLMNSGQYRNAFNFGNSKIEDLKKGKKRNYYLEYLTWASLALHPNPLYKKEGCAALNEYLSLNEYFFQRYNSLEAAKKISYSICTLNTPVNISAPFSQSSEITMVHWKDQTGATSNIHFKNYYLLKPAATFENFFSRLSLNDFDKISTADLSKGYYYALDSTFEISMKSFKKLAEESIPSYIKRVYKTENWYKSQNFVVISQSKTSAALSVTANELERVLSYYNRDIGLPRNTELIFVYLSGTKDSVYYDLKKFYRLTAPKALGFTHIASRSIVAWIPKSNLIGTLKHELVHLLYFNNYFFAPPWFEEGLASLFEESRFMANGTLRGVNNWRLKYLKLLKPAMLDSLVEGFLANDHRKIEIVRDDLEQQVEELDSIAMRRSSEYDFAKKDLWRSTENFADLYMLFCKDALARYFLMYLQSKDKLKLVLSQIDENERQTFDTPKFVQSNTIIIKAMGTNDVKRARQMFSEWFALQNL